MAPDQHQDKRDTGSITQSLQDLWRGVTFLFKRSSQEPAEEVTTPKVSETPLEASWRDITETRRQVGELAEQSKITGDIDSAQRALEELKLKTAAYEKAVEEMEGPIRTVLGKNFLGVEEWKRGSGVRVEGPPPIPEYITPQLLNSHCPLSPMELIKDSHILVLVPRTVDGQPYNALKLGELCKIRSGLGYDLIRERVTESAWTEEAWAKASPLASEWILLPKRDPRPSVVQALFPSDSKLRHFRDRNIVEQETVLRNYYQQDYRPAKALELLTMTLLFGLVNEHARLLPGNVGFRCAERDTRGGRVVITSVKGLEGLVIRRYVGDGRNPGISFALARKA
jgi:hypothetical protein